MSIVRIGMSEDNKFGDGYDAIFSKKASSKPAAKGKVSKTPVAKGKVGKKPAAKKK